MSKTNKQDHHNNITIASDDNNIQLTWKKMDQNWWHALHGKYSATVHSTNENTIKGYINSEPGKTYHIPGHWETWETARHETTETLAQIVAEEKLT